MCLKQISSLFTIKLHTSLAPVRLFCSHVCAPDDAGGDEEAPRIVVSLLLFLKVFMGEKRLHKKEARERSATYVTTTTTEQVNKHGRRRCSRSEKQLVVSSFFQPNDAWEAKEKEEEGGGKAEVVPD